MLMANPKVMKMLLNLKLFRMEKTNIVQLQTRKKSSQFKILQMMSETLKLWRILKSLTCMINLSRKDKS